MLRKAQRQRRDIFGSRDTDASGVLDNELHFRTQATGFVVRQIQGGLARLAPARGLRPPPPIVSSRIARPIPSVGRGVAEQR
jgi:hypothetical protein